MSNFDTYLHRPKFRAGVRYFLLPNRDVLDPLPPASAPKPPPSRTLIDDVRALLADEPATVPELHAKFGRATLDPRSINRALNTLLTRGIVEVVGYRALATYQFGRRANKIYGLIKNEKDLGSSGSPQSPVTDTEAF
jgi:hypothetical protein